MIKPKQRPQMMWFCRNIQLRTPLVPTPCQPGAAPPAWNPLCLRGVRLAGSQRGRWLGSSLPFLQRIYKFRIFSAQPWVANCRCPLLNMSTLPYKMPWFFLSWCSLLVKGLFPQPSLTFLFWFTLFIPEQMIPKAIIRRQALKHSTGAHLLRVVAGGIQWHKTVLQVSKKRQNPNYCLLAWSGFVLQQNYLSLSAKITSS